MKLFYATTNYTKIQNMKRILKDLPIEIITPDDLGIHIEVEENGKSVIENAIKKAKAYYNIVKMPTIAEDISLYIKNLSLEKQPGLFVRRVNGKRLSDNEMIKYYKKVFAENGGQMEGHYIYGLALITDLGVKSLKIKDEDIIFTSKPSKKIHKGFPLESLSIDKNSNKYFSEINNNDNNFESIFDRECLNFIKINFNND